MDTRSEEERQDLSLEVEEETGDQQVKSYTGDQEDISSSEISRKQVQQEEGDKRQELIIPDDIKEIESFEKTSEEEESFLIGEG